MANNAVRVSDLPAAANVALTDRLVVLRQPNVNPSVRTVSVSTLLANLSYANTTTAGVVKVGNNLSVNATGFLNAEAGGAADTGDITFTNTIISQSTGDNIFVYNPNNAVLISGSWLTQMSATMSVANNIWGQGNTESYTWNYQEPSNDTYVGYAEQGAWVQELTEVGNSDIRWAQYVYNPNNTLRFWGSSRQDLYDTPLSILINNSVNAYTFDANGVFSIPPDGDIKRNGVSVIGTGQIDGGNAFTTPTAEITVDGGGA